MAEGDGYRRVGEEAVGARIEEDGDAGSEASEGELVSNPSDDSDHDCEASNLITNRQRKLNPDIPTATVSILDLGEAEVVNADGTHEEDAETMLRGAKIYLVGTAHFSRESQDDVIRTVKETEPDLVMVELCRSRVNVLELDEERLLREASELGMDKVLAHIRAAGLVQGIMHILLVSMSANITRQLGMAPGGEFRAALRAAKEVAGCQLDLGDRPVEITLQRAIGSLSWWKKLRLFAYILLSHNNKISPEDVEKCKEKDMLEQLLAELAGEFPELSRIFVHERDLFMAARLRTLLTAVSYRKLQAHRTNRPEGEEEACEPVVVVSVVGMGHVPGITAHFHRTDIDVRALLQVPARSRMAYVVKYGVLGGILGATIASAFFVFKGVKWGYQAIVAA